MHHPTQKSSLDDALGPAEDSRTYVRSTFKAGDDSVVGLSFSWVELVVVEERGSAFFHTFTAEVGCFVSSRKPRISRA